MKEEIAFTSKLLAEIVFKSYTNPTIYISLNPFYIHVNPGYMVQVTSTIYNHMENFFVGTFFF